MIFVGSKLKRTISRLKCYRPRKCRVCGCTQDDCSGCVERTGEACSWIEPDLCSACTGDALIEQECTRHVEVEGWTAEHDDDHDKCEMRKAAECYAQPPAMRTWRWEVLPGGPRLAARRVRVPRRWPWAAEWWKPVADRVRELIKAGSLYRAERNRQKRAGHLSTAKRMDAKAWSMGLKIDRLTRDPAWQRRRNRVGLEGGVP